MSLFANAVILKPVKSIAKKTKDEIEMPGLKTVAMVDALIKTLSTLQSTLTKELKDTAAVLFYTQAAESGKAPVTFRGVDGDASGAFECRKRSTNSPLAEDEVELLVKSGLIIEEQTIVPEMFGFNSELIKNPKTMALIEGLLGPAIATGKLPAGLIVKQEKVSKRVVTDQTLADACSMKSKLSPVVLSMLTSLAIKPKLEVTDLSAILAEVTSIIAPVVIGVEIENI